MDNVFTRSWNITKLSFKVIGQDKELILFPIISAVLSLILIVSLAIPTIIASIIAEESISAIGYIAVALIYFGIAFIATFFNTCTVYTVKKRFEGGNATFSESMIFAFSKIKVIAAWSLITATVGMILRILEDIAERLGNIGELILKLAISLLGFAWAMITVFVVPAMVYNDIGPIAALKKSAVAFKKTWGENMVRYIGLGLIQLIVSVIILVVFFVLGFVFSAISPWGLIASILLGIILVILTAIVFNVANAVFNTALFVYANQGKVPSGFDKETMQNAFRKKN